MKLRRATEERLKLSMGQERPVSPQVATPAEAVDGSPLLSSHL